MTTVPRNSRFIAKDKYQRFGLALCEALGEDPSQIHKITLEVGTSIPSTVTLEKYLTVGQAEDSGKMIRRFRLHPEEIEEEA